MNYLEFNPLKLSMGLINCPSVSPAGDEPIELLINSLVPLGFECHKLKFGDVTNLYARKGSTGRNLCFAGHTDVVPAGEGWLSDPFKAELKDGYLYGRGAVDMKPAIASFIEAVVQAGEIDGSISLLISGNEEGDATDGTPKVLSWLRERGEKLDGCIVGEPTNPTALGQMVKIGRRGSVNFELTVRGVQGHVAYPESAVNPVSILAYILADLKRLKLDSGTQYFPPSNLEITNLQVGNEVRNVIPALASASINVRFNDQQTKEGLYRLIENLSAAYIKYFDLKVISHFDPFINEPGELALIIREVARTITSQDTSFGTDGGTSDARFIHNFCPVVEFGLTNEMAHKSNERVKIEDIMTLAAIYKATIQRFFNRSFV